MHDNMSKDPLFNHNRKLNSPENDINYLSLKDKKFLAESDK
jgi:hypothetical protein